jgi:hypothetical protein
MFDEWTARQDNAILLNVNNAGWFASYQGGLNGWDGTGAITGSNYRGGNNIVAGGLRQQQRYRQGGRRARPRIRVHRHGFAQPRRHRAPGVYSDGVYQGKAAIVDAKDAAYA